jgi:hypothetical protein
MTLFQRQQSSDLDLQKMQETLEKTSRIPFSSAIVRGQLVKRVKIKSGETSTVSTELGRAWVGFIVVNHVQDAGSVYVVVNDVEKKVNNKKVIALKGIGTASAQAYFSFWFF